MDGVATERERASAALARPVYRCIFHAIIDMRHPIINKKRHVVDEKQLHNHLLLYFQDGVCQKFEFNVRWYRSNLSYLTF